MTTGSEPELCPTCELRKSNVGRNVYDMEPLLRRLVLIAVDQDRTRARRSYACETCATRWTTVISLEPTVRTNFLFFGEGDNV
jgi:hypothetical protein